MFFKHHVAQVALLVCVSVVTGCITGESQLRALASKQSPPPSVQKAFEPPVLTPTEQERRIMAMTHYAMGLSLEMREEPRKAVDEFFKAAMLDSTHELLVTEASRRLVLAKDPDRLVQLLLRATDPTNAPTSFFATLGLAYHFAGKTDLGLLSCEHALKRNPFEMAAYQALYRIHVDRNQHAQAYQILKHASEIQNAPPAFFIDLAQLFFEFTRLQPKEMESVKGQVRALLKKIRPADVTDNTKLLALTEHHRFLGDISKAAEVYELLIVRLPDELELRELATELYIFSNDFGKATLHIDNLLRQDPANPQANRLMGMLASEKKDFAKAEEFYSKVLLLNPAFEPGYFELVGAQLSHKNPKGAWATIEKAQARFPASFRQEYFAAMVQNQLKNHTNALKHLQRAETIARRGEPANLTLQFFFQMASTLERAKRLPEAETLFKRLLKENPNYHEVMNYLGYMWAERGENLPEAKKLIEQALKVEPDNSAYLDSIAWVYFKMGDPKKALDFLLRSIKRLEEPDAVVHDHLGDVYMALKSLSKARDAYKKSIQIEPNADIQKKLDALSASR